MVLLFKFAPWTWPICHSLLFFHTSIYLLSNKGISDCLCTLGLLVWLSGYICELRKYIYVCKSFEIPIHIWTGFLTCNKVVHCLTHRLSNSRVISFLNYSLRFIQNNTSVCILKNNSMNFTWFFQRKLRIQ